MSDGVVFEKRREVDMVFENPVATEKRSGQDLDIVKMAHKRESKVKDLVDDPRDQQLKADCIRPLRL